MKVKLYVDLFNGADPSFLMAVATPASKSPDARRFCFEVELPDRFFPDETQTVKAEEVVGEK